MRRVVCAAARAEDGRIIVGIRHYSGDMYSQIFARGDGRQFENRYGEDQGFVDQLGIYMTREEAWIIANEAGQIINYIAGQEGILYSEHLY